MYVELEKGPLCARRINNKNIGQEEVRDGYCQTDNNNTKIICKKTVSFCSSSPPCSVVDGRIRARPEVKSVPHK